MNTSTFRDFLNGAIADALREPVGPGDAIDAIATAEEITAAMLECIAGSWELDDQVPVNAESVHDGVLRGIAKVLPGSVLVESDWPSTNPSSPASPPAHQPTRSNEVPKIIADPLQAVLAEELAGRTENWSELANNITTALHARFEITERHAAAPGAGVIPDSVIAQASTYGQDRAAENPGLDVPAELRALAALLDQSALPAGWLTRVRLRAHLRAAQRADRAFWSAPPAAQAQALDWYLGMGQSVGKVLAAAAVLTTNERSQGRRGSLSSALHAWRTGVASPGRQLMDIASKDRGGWGSIRHQAKYARDELSHLGIQ